MDLLELTFSSSIWKQSASGLVVQRGVIKVCYFWESPFAPMNQIMNGRSQFAAKKNLFACYHPSEINRDYTFRLPNIN